MVFQMSRVLFFVLCILACIFCAACIIMGICSLNFSYWDTYEYVGRNDQKTALMNLNRTRGIFLECWHDSQLTNSDFESTFAVRFVKDKCVHIPLWESDGMNPLQSSVISTRQVHIAFFIIGMVLALAAMLIFLIGAIYIGLREKRSGTALFSHRHPWFVLTLICTILCVIGAYILLFTFFFYHVFKDMEFDYSSSFNYKLPRVYSEWYDRGRRNGSSLLDLIRYWGSMYYLAWGCFILLALAAILFAIALIAFCGCCCDIGEKEMAPPQAPSMPTVMMMPQQQTPIYIPQEQPTSVYYPTQEPQFIYPNSDVPPVSYVQ